MLKYIFTTIYVVFIAFLGFAKPKTVMLVLGSANSDILSERIEVAYRLYKTQEVDQIIVSGGCGAHGSTICEATAMSEGLQLKGVPQLKIYKEENAKTTVQNYIFSRILRDEKGNKIIQPGDTVFVVSNHWHAISVAARFQKYDQVVSRFYIEGALQPKTTDKLDYASIFNGQVDNNKFIIRGKWLTPDAVWKVKDSTYYLMDQLIYVTDEQNRSFALKERKDAFPYLDTISRDGQVAFIDEGDFWWIKAEDTLLKVDKVSLKVLENRSWNKFIKDMPIAWHHKSFSAGFMYRNKLILFAHDIHLIAERKGDGFVYVKEDVGNSLFRNWPFAWGKGNVSGVFNDIKNKQILLYRNMETLNLDPEKMIMESPKPLKLKWIEEQKTN